MYLCTYWVNVRMWEYLCPTKYLNTWPLSAAPGHLLPLPSERGRARVQQTRRRWDQPASAMAAMSAQVLVTGVLQFWHQYCEEYKETNFVLKIFANQIVFCWGWEFSMWRQLVQMPTQQRSKVSEKEKRRDWKKLSANIVYSPQYRCQNWGSLVVNLRTSVAGHGNLLYRGPKTVSVKRRAKSSGTNIDLWPKLC